MNDTAATPALDTVIRALDAAQLQWKAENGGDDASCINMPDELTVTAVLRVALADTPEVIDLMAEEIDLFGLSNTSASQNIARAVLAALRQRFLGEG